MESLDPQLLDATTSVSRRRTVVNAGANYANLGVTLILGLFLEAYLVRKLGEHQYALWPLTSTCVAFLTLIPIGIGAGAGRFLAHALGGKRLAEVEQITTSLFVSMCVAAVWLGRRCRSGWVARREGQS